MRLSRLSTSSCSTAAVCVVLVFSFNVVVAVPLAKGYDDGRPGAIFMDNQVALRSLTPGPHDCRTQPPQQQHQQHSLRRRELSGPGSDIAQQKLRALYKAYGIYRASVQSKQPVTDAIRQDYEAYLEFRRTGLLPDRAWTLDDESSAERAYDDAQSPPMPQPSDGTRDRDAQVADENQSGGGQPATDAEGTEDMRDNTSLFAAVPLAARSALAAAWSHGSRPGLAGLLRSSATAFAKNGQLRGLFPVAGGYYGRRGQSGPLFLTKPVVFAH